MSRTRVFRNRLEAGAALARELMGYAGRENVVVLALSAAGVPVAYEVAVAIGARLDVFVVRKLKSPANHDIPFGALASGGICFVDRKIVADLGISDSQIAAALEQEAGEVARRDHIYRGARRFPDLPGQVVIFVDECLIRGSMMRSAVEAVRKRNPSRIIVAAPVASREECAVLTRMADECVCLSSPRPFHDVGNWYADFPTITDQQAASMIQLAAARTGLFAVA